MTEVPPVQSLIQSFIVRFYRFDPAEQRQVAGVIEAVDGSGTATPFVGTDQLGVVLCRLLTDETTRGKEDR